MDAAVYAEMGDEDIALAIQLMQEDAEEIMSVSTRKGKQVQGTETDAQVALNLFLQDLQATETSFNDRRMTRSMLHAIQTDGAVLSQALDEEKVARADRNMSVALSNGDDASVASQAAAEAMSSDEEFIEKLSFIYNTGFNIASGSGSYRDDDTASISQPESSSWAASRPSSTFRPKTGNCDACGDEKHFAHLARAPCRHEYCRECLTRLFRDASNDESLFPPRCCKQPIPLIKNQVFIDDDVVRIFRQKAIEFSTPRRTYCHNRNCARFIPSTNYVGDIATCDECLFETCMTCKGATHNGDCPNDEQLQQVIAIARDQHWQRCQNCWAMVELNTGCNHMTCRCKFEFCYVCGARWKTCQCDHWDEHRLYARAAQINARDQEQPAPVERIPFRVHFNGQQQLHDLEHHERDIEPDMEEVEEELVEPVDDVFDEEDEPDMPEIEEPVRAIAQQARPQPVPEEPALDHFHARMQELVEHLRINHECEHDRWFSRGGPRECEECGDVMPLFIYECRQCHIMACRRCRYHRL